MKRLSLRARTPPLMLALLSLGIASLQSMRAVRVSISEPVTGAAATRRGLANQPRRWAEEMRAESVKVYCLSHPASSAIRPTATRSRSWVGTTMSGATRISCCAWPPA